jgi:hypothetical protein
VEILVLVTVGLYALLIFVDLGTNALFFPGGCGVRMQCIGPRRGCAAWLATFMMVDCTFLSIFVVEFVVRLYAFGWRYLKDRVTCFDAAIVVISLSFLTWQAASSGCDRMSASTVNEVSTVARFVRVLRVFRLLTAVHKINRTRQAAKLMRQKVRCLPSCLLTPWRLLRVQWALELGVLRWGEDVIASLTFDGPRCPS